mgnify:CR=1 FL=1
MTLQLVILALVSVQRIGELIWSRANMARLLAKGGHEVGSNHYPLIVAVHVVWLAGLWWLAPELPVNWVFLGLYLVLQVFRAWILMSLGRRWTTRVVVVPGETLVKRGPYKFLNHPNYVLIVCEIACLPLVFGLWEFALLFSLLNGILLWWRIRVENAALSPLREREG